MKNYYFLVKYIKKFNSKLIIVGIFTLFSAFLTILPPYISKIILDTGIYKNKIDVVVIGSITLIILYIISFWVKYEIGVILSKTSSDFISEIKKGIFCNVIKMPMPFFDSKQTGYITERIKEVDSVSVVFSPVFTQFFVSCISFIGAVIIVLSMEWKLLLVILCLVPCYIILTAYTTKNLCNTSKVLLEASAKTSGQMQENIGGIAEVKSLNLEKKKIIEVNKQINDVAKKTAAKGKFLSLGSEGVQGLTNISTAILVLVSGLLILKNEMTVGEYIAITQYATIIFMPVQLFSSFNMMIQPAIIAIKRVKELLEGENEENEGDDIKDEIEKIEFQAVNFEYNEQTKVLQNQSFIIEKKDKVALIGPNGSGKTTIIKLILKFYKVQSGKILINGRDIDEYKVSSLRKKLGIVSQNIFLFSGTLFENISSVKEGATEKEIEEALVKSGWENPDLDLYIAEGGKNLSGGQKQKIAIARMLITDADVLILDEATANLDVESKKIIKSAIKNIFKEKICIFITHDSEMLQYLNHIIELD